MKIKLKKRQEISFKKNKFYFLPFFSGEKIKFDGFEDKSDILKEASLVKEGKSKMFFSDNSDFYLVNLGEKKNWNQRKFLVNLRKAVLVLKENRNKEAVFVLDRIIPEKADLPNLTKQLSENILLAFYEFVRYKKKPKEGWHKINIIEIVWPDNLKYQKELDNGIIVGRAVNFTRDLSNTPGKDMTPQGLVEAAKKVKNEGNNISLEVFDEKKLKKLSMGGILGVSQGSVLKPRLIILKYFGRAKSKEIDLSFVGKGITFDTGGLDIKPFDSMKGMYMDMSGGSAVLGAILAISKIKIPLNIICLIPAVENMPSGEALRQGDILRSYSGKTIEVLSTDAEGRIILADAISYSIKNHKPKIIVDVATLTGASLVALGYRATALFTNILNTEELIRVGEDSGDYVWPLPCWEEYEEEIKGTFADVANLGKYLKQGGAISGALFLKYFVEDNPWIHLDIAPTMASIENQGLAKGSTGSGTRYLIKLAQDFQKIEKNL